MLFVPTWYPTPEAPVAALFVRDLAHAIALNHEVTVLAPVSASPQIEVDDLGVRTVRVISEEGGVAADLGRLRTIDHWVRRLRHEGWPPQLIHAQAYPRGALSVLVGRMRRLPVVVTENFSGLLDPSLGARRTMLARLAYRHAAAVLPDSTLLARRLSALEPRGRYVVVPEVVDVAAFAHRAEAGRSESSPRRIVAVSMLVHRKGLHDLVEALRLLKAEGEDVALTIIGEGPERPKLERLAAGLPVELLGALPRSEVVATVSEADVFAMPTLADPFGIAAVEALAAGVPVVVTDAAGSAELVSAHGGIVVPAADPRALQRAISELLRRRGDPDADATGPLAAVCGPEAVAAQVDAVYQRVLAGEAPQPAPTTAV